VLEFKCKKSQLSPKYKKNFKMKSLYIHIPFCDRKCFYCSFVVSIGQVQRSEQYIECLKREAELYKGSNIASVYIGGGTPTFLDVDQLECLVGIVKEYFNVEKNCEWTIESNPENLNAAKLRVLKKSGVSRISLGIQTFNDEYLCYLGRNHDAESAVRAYYDIRAAGFENVSVDLMFSFPGQTEEHLEKDILKLGQLKSEHVSLYALTIEKNSKFYTKNFCLDDNDVRGKQYVRICGLLQQMGFEQYEISNFAKPGYYSKHNMHYWQGGRYIGLGVGAHSFMGRQRTWNVSRLMDYMCRVEQGKSPQDGRDILTSYDQLKEILLFGLRMNQGVNISQAERQCGCRLQSDDVEIIRSFIKEGFLMWDKKNLKTTERGRLVLDELCARMV